MFRNFIVAFVLLLPFALFGASGQATVKVESAAVYSQRSASSKVVRSLKKGDAVIVELALAGDDGEWCSVREPDQKISLGYMRCETLAREPRPQPVVVAPAPAAPRATQQAAAPGGGTSRAPSDWGARRGEDYMASLRYWTGWPPPTGGPLRSNNNMFDFTAEQQAQVEDLANRMGVTGCRQQIETTFRKYARELTRPSLHPTPGEKQRVEQMTKEINRFAYPCEVKRLDLLERLPDLMTPEQKKENAKTLASFQADLAKDRKVLSRMMYRGIY